MAPPPRKLSNAAGSKEVGYRNDAPISVNGLGDASHPPNFSNHDLRNSMADLTVCNGNPISKPAGLIELGHATQSTLRLDDEQTHVSASSIKPSSLDGKSTASGTTFAMDEKESLRPDDSASVKAADEEDSSSGHGSGAPNSRFGSEAGGRAFRDQFHEISERIGRVPGGSTTAGREEVPGIEEETIPGHVSPLARPLQESVASAQPSINPANGLAFAMEYRNPDEKLLEALVSPKDRLFVLRLEHDIVEFIQQSGDQILDLKTPNSFCRLLAHKLADYYALTHHVDSAMSAVRLYRTPYCRIRTPLSSFSQGNPGNDNSASTQPAVKIMRRAGLVKEGHRLDSGPTTTASSTAPSKAGSDAGDDSGRITGLISPTESVIGKDRLTMTREEREAKYKETRDRIFRGFDDSENAEAATSNDTGLGISRCSSTNGKRRTRKHRNNDDGFEARSHYTAYYPTMQYAGPAFEQIPASPAHFNPGIPQQYPIIGESSGMSPPIYSPAYEPGYHPTINTPGYPASLLQYPMGTSSTANGFNNVQPFPGCVQQMTYQYFQQPQSSPALSHHSPAISSPALSSSAQSPRPQSQTSDPRWSSGSYQYQPQYQYQTQFQQSRSQQQFYPLQPQQQSAVPGPQTVAYQYGQLPCPSNLPGSRNVHPLPGSYSRQQSLNPQIRSFVPGSRSEPASTGNTSQDATPNHETPNSGGNTPGLPRNVPSSVPVAAPGMLQFGSFVPASDSKPLPSRKSQSNSIENHNSVKSTLAKWGTPANLPPKPPPPDPPSMPEGRHSLPQSVPAPPSLPKVTNGQQIPTFQNGLYAASGVRQQ
ncbi:MAG: hypothetical protein Q9170_000772 [Blastenia crenularia]